MSTSLLEDPHTGQTQEGAGPERQAAPGVEPLWRTEVGPEVGPAAAILPVHVPGVPEHCHVPVDELEEGVWPQLLQVKLLLTRQDPLLELLDAQVWLLLKFYLYVGLQISPALLIHSGRSEMHGSKLTGSYSIFRFVLWYMFV